MPAIRDYAVTIYAASTASMVCEMPLHETGDLLVACVNKDTATGFTTPSGWTALQTQVSGGAGGGIYTKRAASAAEAVTFALTSETCLAVIVAVKGCYGSTAADAVSASAKSGADDSTLPLAGVGITPLHDNSLILQWLSTDTGFGPAVLPGWVNLFMGDTGANSGCLSYTCQRTAAAIAAPNHWAASQDDSRAFVIAIRDDGNNAEVEAYISPGTVPATLISSLVGIDAGAAGIIAANKGTWVTASPMDIASVGSKTMTWVAGSVAADSGFNPFRAAQRHGATSSTTVLYGQEMRFTAAMDLTALSGVIFGTFRMQVPRDYLDLSNAARGGLLVGIADAENDYRFWTIAAQFSKTTDPSNRQNFAIEVSTTDTDYATSGTLALATINDLYLAGSGYYGTLAVEFSELWLLGETQLAGGTAASPFEFLAMERAVNNGSGYIPLFVRSGAAATIWTRLKFGGGDPIHVEVSLRTFQFPRKSDGVNYLDFHVSNNVIGVEFHGLDRGSGDVDTLHFLGCVFTSDSAYYWRFNASHDADADLDFSGSTVVGATVTLRSTVSLDNMAFTDSVSFTQNTAELDGCTMQNTKIMADDPSKISNCSFTSSGAGYAMEITTAGTYSFVGNIFSGYAGSDGSTGNEAIYNNSGGAVTLNISGGGGTPSIRNGAGASTTVNNNAVLTISGLVTGSDVVVYAAGTTTVLASAQENSGTTYAYQYPVADAGDSVDVGVFLAGYIPFYIRGYTLAAVNASLPAAQVVDRAYLT